MKIKITTICLALAIAILMGIPVQVLASVSNDQVQSQHIKEADGTSGQNTNAGSGVKTGHIQDGAITTPKIADGQVTAPKIANGAVTDAKITGPISASKIQSTGLNADAVDGLHAADFAPSSHGHYQSDIVGLEESLTGKADVSHNHDSAYQKKYAQMVVVAKSGGDFADISEALNSITDASESKPYLVKIMPGVYQLPQYTAIYMVSDYVFVEGSGRDVTTILQPSLYDNAHLLRILCEKCGVRDLSLKASMGPWSNNGAVTSVSTNAYLDNIAVEALDDETIGVALGGTATVKNMTVKRGGISIFIGGGSGGRIKTATIDNVKIFHPELAPSAWTAVANATIGVATIKNSVIEGNINNGAEGIEIYNSKIGGNLSAGQWGDIRAVNSQIEGVRTGPMTLFNCFDANFQQIN